MNKIKLILCLLLSMSLIPLGSFGVFASSDSAAVLEGSTYNTELEFLSYLGITDGIDTTDYYRTITRAEFVSMVVKMLNISHTSESDGRFTDVKENNPHISAIYTAYNFGLLKGTSDTTFSPDMPITYAAAVKILVSALGYEEYAYLSGGYPTGYIKQADYVGILDGTIDHSVDASLSCGTVVTMISNSLTANLRKIVSVTDEYVQTAVADGENCLTQYFKLTHISGVVTTAGYHSMIDGYNEEESMFEIGDVALDCSLSNAEKYLGYDVDAWYDAKTKNVAAVRTKNTNNTLTINGSDVESFSDFKLTSVVDDYDNTKSYTIDKGYTFVLNGRVKPASKSDFCFESGTLTLIDNNGDRCYDVVVSNQKSYVVVRGINTTDKIVYDKNRNDIRLILKEENGYHFNLTKDGTPIDVAEISADDVLEVAQSADGFLADVRVCTGSVRGTITAIGQNEIYVNGEMYEPNEYFTKYCTPEIGQSGTFCFDPDGRITYISELYINSVQYAYFLDMAVSHNSLAAADVKIKVFTESGKIEIFSLCERLSFEGESVYNTDEELSKALMNGTIPNYQLIRFGTDANGLVNMIDLSEDVDENADLVAKYAVTTSDNSLTRYVKAEEKRDTGVGEGNAYWRKAGSAFAPYFTVGSTVIMQVPKSIITSRINNTPIDGKFDESAFTITGTGSLPNYGWRYVDAYDYDDSMTPKIVVMYYGSAKPGEVVRVVPDENDPIHLVENVVDCINEDGEKTKRIYSYSNNGFRINDIAVEVLSELELNSLIPKIGEAVRLSFSGKYINGIARDVISDGKGGFTVQYGVDGVGDTPIDAHTYISGKVLSCVDSSIVVKTDNYPDSAIYPTPIDGLCSLRATSDTVVAVLNTETGLVEHGVLSEISDIRSVGEEDASYVCIGLGAYEPEFIIIYK